MLVLTRRLDESIVIGDGIVVKIISVRGSGDQAVVRLGIEAPPAVRVWRKEVYDQVAEANRAALQVPPGGELPVVPARTSVPRHSAAALSRFLPLSKGDARNHPGEG